MRYKELKLGIVTGILCLGLLNGCKGYSCDFHSSEEAQKVCACQAKRQIQGKIYNLRSNGNIKKKRLD